MQEGDKQSGSNPGRGVLVPRKDVKIKFDNIFLNILGTFAIYSMIIPMVIIDVWAQIYQAIYFTAAGIPKIPRGEYVVMEKWKLPKLTLMQRIHCMYCDYGNGLTSWIKAMVTRTEIYSCAIKNSSKLIDQPHTEGYWERSHFE